MELLNTLGIDWRLLLWQTVTFFVLLAILGKYAYGPVLAALAAREERIAKGLNDAAAAETARADAERMRQEILADAHRASAQLLGEAKTAAEVVRGESVLRTRAEVERLLRDGQAQLSQERAAMLADAESELADLLRASLDKVVGRAVTGADHDRLIAEAVAAVKKARV